MVFSKGMTNEGDKNVSRTTTIRMDSRSKICKANKHHKSSTEMLFHPTPRKAITCHPHLTIEASGNEYGGDAIDGTMREEWVTRVQMER